MNKPVSLDLSILDMSKIAMHDYWYDYVKQKCIEKAKLCYMDTDSFIVHANQKTFMQFLLKTLRIGFDASNNDGKV